MGDKYAKQQALQSPKTLATVVHAIVKQTLGEEAYDWDPITVYLELRDELSAEPDSAALDRWSAMQIVMTSDAFFKRIDAFLGICNTLAEGQPFFVVFDPVTVEEAAWAITEVSLNRELLSFSYPITKYLKLILAKDGYTESTYPSIFQEIFNKKPDTLAVREAIGNIENRDNVENFIDEQLKDMVYQFNNIPSLKNLDDIILKRSLNEYIGTIVDKGETKNASGV